MFAHTDLKTLIAKHAYLVEGLAPRQQGLVAQLLENQEAYGRGLLEDTTSADLAMPQTYAAALIRAVYPRLIANDLCSVQPLRAPVGKVFYMDHAREAFSTTLTADTDADQSKIAVKSTYGWSVGDLVTVGSGPTAEVLEIVALSPDGGEATLDMNLAHPHLRGETASVAYSTSRTTEGGPIARAKLALTSADITARKYALGVCWTGEAAEDLRATQGLNAEQELVRAVAGVIAREIDDQILADMLANASAGSIPYSLTKEEGWTETEWRRELFAAIVQANNAVFKARHRDADFLVGDPDTIGLIERVEQFATTTADERGAVGTVRVGTLNNRWAVYKHSGFTPNRILVGIRGDGYVYAPYVPLSLTPPVYEPATDRWVRNVRTRAGMLLTVPDAYAVIEITE